MDWQSDFLKLYMSNNVEDFSCALDLKRKHIPQKLYRYRSTANISYIIDEISDGEIYLAHPNELNDPFDACSLLKSEHPSHYFRNPNTFKDSLRQHFSNDFLAQVFAKSNWYDELMCLVAKESVPLENQEKAVHALVQIVMEQFYDINKSFNRMIHSTARLACFTTKPDNIPMWNHYAQQHGGVCLEYEIKAIESIYTLNRLFPVYYTDSLPDAVERLMGKEKPEFGIMDYFLIHKLNDWSYESEWRLIYNVGSWYFSEKEVPEDFWQHGKHLGFVRPTRVILGAKIKELNESLIRQTCEYYKIPVIKYGYTEYGLREL